MRATHRKKTNGPRWWLTRVNPFAEAWPVVEGWLSAEPSASANELMERLATMIPEVYESKAQLRTLQRRVREWRSERAKEMVLGKMRKAGTKTVEHQYQEIGTLESPRGAGRYAPGRAMDIWGSTQIPENKAR